MVDECVQAGEHGAEGLNELGAIVDPLCGLGAFEAFGDFNGAVFDYGGVAEGVDYAVEAAAATPFAGWRGADVLDEFKGEADDFFAMGRWGIR